MLAYIKDCTNLNGPTKMLIKLKKGSVSEDRLASASASFECFEKPENVNNGDILILVSNQGKFIYYGTVTSVSLEDKKIECSQMSTYLKGSFNYSKVNHITSSYIEDAIKQIFNSYKSGEYYGSTYMDPLIIEKYNLFAATSVDSTSGNLESDKDDEGNDKNTQMDFEDWMYSLYQTYGIVFDFTIPVGQTNPSVKIWKPNYSYLNIAGGFECVSNIQPTLSEQTSNRLIIFWQSEDEEHTHTANEYRETYILTSSGIVEHPTALTGRPNIVNTTVVYSDDELEDIKKANLSETLYDHKIVFEVNLSNNLYKFDDLKLDLPIHVYTKGDYFETIITGKDFSFEEDAISKLKLTCGYVRTSLTKKLLTQYKR